MDRRIRVRFLPSLAQEQKWTIDISAESCRVSASLASRTAIWILEPEDLRFIPEALRSKGTDLTSSALGNAEDGEQCMLDGGEVAVSDRCGDLYRSGSTPFHRMSNDLLEVLDWAWLGLYGAGPREVREELVCLLTQYRGTPVIPTRSSLVFFGRSLSSGKSFIGGLVDHFESSALPILDLRGVDELTELDVECIGGLLSRFPEIEFRVRPDQEEPLLQAGQGTVRLEVTPLLSEGRPYFER